MQILITKRIMQTMFIWNALYFRAIKKMQGYSRSRADFIELLYRKYFIMEEENIINWCYGLGERPTDFIMTEWLLDAMPNLYMQDEQIYEYNQFWQKRSMKSCTLFSPIWAVSDLWNIEIDLAEAKEWDEESYNRGRVKDSGWYVAFWVEHICKCWNKSKHWKELWQVAFYSFELKNNSLLKKILDHRYTACIWYRGNAKYNNDKNADWILNNTDRWNSTYGHAVGTIRSVNNNPCRIKDNYKWNKHNIYDVEHNFSDIPCFYDMGYIITKVKEDNLERIKELNEFRTVAIRSIEDLWRMRHLTKDTKFQDELHRMANEERKKLKDIDEQLILLH